MNIQYNKIIHYPINQIVNNFFRYSSTTFLIILVFNCAIILLKYIEKIFNEYQNKYFNTIITYIKLFFILIPSLYLK